MSDNIKAWNAYADHVNACCQCGPANAEADPEAHCEEGRRLWELFQDAQHTTSEAAA